MIVYMLDKNGNRMSQLSKTIVDNSQFSSKRKEGPLKPDYVRSFKIIVRENKIPSGFGEKVEFEVGDFEFEQK